MKQIFKKLIAAALVILFTQTPSLSEEISELYLIKNSKMSDIKAVSDFYSRQNNLIVNSQTGYSVSYITDKDYFLTFFEQTGDDVYFYYFSPSETDYSYKDIISRLKNKKYSCKREKNKPTKQIFYNKAKSITETQKLTANIPQSQTEIVPSSQVYDFSDSAQEKYDKINQVLTNRLVQVPQFEVKQEQNNKIRLFAEKDDIVTLPEPKTQKTETPVIKAGVYDIPGGLTINAVTQSDIETSSLSENDRISAILQSDLYVNKQLKAKTGSIVYGNVTEVKKAGGGYKNGSLVLQFDTILTTDGERLTLKTEKCNFSMADNARGKKIAGQIAGNTLGGAAGGLLTGLLTSLFSSSTSVGQGLGYGAAIGAGAGVISGIISAAASKGEDVSVTEGTALVLKTVSH